MDDPQYYQAVYAFHAENDAELELVEGDIIEVYHKDGPWWEGQLADGRRGLFPANRVMEYQTPEETGTTAAYQLGAGEADASGVQVQYTDPSQQQWGQQQQAQGYGYSAYAMNAGYDEKYMHDPYAQQPVASPTAAQRAPLVPLSNMKPQSSSSAQVADVKKPAKDAGKGASDRGAAGGSGKDAAKAGDGGGTVQSPPKQPTSNTKFGIWASNMAVIAAVTTWVLALGSLIWAGQKVSRNPSWDAVAGSYGLVHNLAVIWYEGFGPGLARSGSKFPLKGIVHLILTAPYWISIPTMFGAVLYIVVFIADCIAAYLGEEYAAPPKQDKAAEAPSQQSINSRDLSLAGRFWFWMKVKIEQNELGAIVFVTLFVAANLVVFFTALAAWIDINNNFGPNEKLSNWAPAAKGFGNMLDFDCAIIVVPVLRSIIRWLYNRATANEQCFARCLRSILAFVPLDRSIEFHKLIALFIVIGSFGHTGMHLVNYCLAPDNTISKFGVWPWVSGGLIIICMQLMYGAVPDNVKRFQFEIFWYSHHCFIGFFVFLLLHGHNGWNPNYWKWFLGPGTLYIIERSLRVYRANQDVILLSITVMKPNVFSLEFAKEGVFAHEYKEGQYVFIMCPKLSAIQWHPFTISSAPQEKTVTLHIRVQGDGSWTRELMDYLTSFGPAGATYFELSRQSQEGRVPGKIIGPDGLQLIQMDGPHSAPTQHVSEYHTVMVCGAGIGVTPVAATLKSVVLHRWKYYMGHCFPDNAYFFWVCNCNEVDSFRWLIRTIKDCEDEMFDMRAKNAKDMNQKRFEFHIFVTSVPKNAQPVNVVVDDEIGFWGVPREDRHLDKVRAPFTEMDIYQIMKCPPQEHTTLADVHIWSGRPKWDARFGAVAQAHPKGEVGVAFCGNPQIGNDLRDCCFKFSSIEEERFFKLHKENF